MSHSTKKQQHEQARKQHKQAMQQHAREAARRGRSRWPMWLLIVGITLMAAFVLVISFR